MEKPEPGFYVSDDGSRRYWDGKQWLTPENGVADTQGGTFFESESQSEKSDGSEKKINPLKIVGIGIAVIVGFWIIVQVGNNLYSKIDDAVVNTNDSNISTSETIGQSNAKSKAEQYIRTMPFSKSGLVKQLMFEGFNESDADYAVNAITVDWNEQAAKKARQYLNTMAFSRSGLINQLTFEGFSNAEAEFGVSAVGY